MNNEERVNDDFFKKLEEDGVSLTEIQREQINLRLKNVLNYQPTIGIFGKTGVGKSSLCNALFGKEVCQIDDIEACTRNIQEVMINFDKSGNGIKLIDVPGVGESTSRDEEYSTLYAKLLPELDLVLWLIKSDDRALASDENFYKNIVKPHVKEGKPFFFVLNQVDKIEPFREWNEEKQEPGSQQFQNIRRKIDNISAFFDIASSQIIPVSANKKYNLTKLVDEFVRALPPEKKVTVFRAVNEEFQSKSTGEHVKKSFLDVVGSVIIASIEAAGDVICTTIETLGNVIANAGDWIMDHIPFRSGKGGCYITTAICNKQEKNDNCYELTQFRYFRDTWLIHQPYGNDLIRQYYFVAPTIVKLINQSYHTEEQYDEINNKYLIPCLKYIEENRLNECRDLYSQMVNNLADRYILWN